MTNSRSFKNRLAAVKRHWKPGEFGRAFAEVVSMRDEWPGSAQLEILWASLIQLLDEPDESLDEVRQALENARELDSTSPVPSIELGHFVDNVEDDPRAAAKFFAEGVERARALLIEALLGQAKSLLQLGKKDESYRCLLEVLHLKHFEPQVKRGGKSRDAGPDVIFGSSVGGVYSLELNGPFAAEIEEALTEARADRRA